MTVKIGQALLTPSGQTMIVRTTAPDGSFTALSRNPLVLSYDVNGRADPAVKAEAFDIIMPRQTDATFLGYRDQDGNRMHCAHTQCPHEFKGVCLNGCVDRVPEAPARQACDPNDPRPIWEQGRSTPAPSSTGTQDRETMLVLAERLDLAIENTGAFMLDAMQLELASKALRAAAQSSGVREDCAKVVERNGCGECDNHKIVAAKIRALSPDTPREITTEQLDQAQFGRVLHKRPDTPREGEK